MKLLSLSAWFFFHFISALGNEHEQLLSPIECDVMRADAIVSKCLPENSVEQMKSFGFAPVCKNRKFVHARRCDEHGDLADILFSERGPFEEFHNEDHYIYDTRNLYCAKEQTSYKCEISRKFSLMVGCIDEDILKNLERAKSKPVCDLYEGFVGSCRCLN